jgi:PAS domain S-box-containing protein
LGEGERRRRAGIALPDDVDVEGLLDSLHDAVAFDNVDGEVVYANAAFLELFGLEDLAELSSLQHDAFVAEGSQEHVRDYHARRMRGETVPDTYELEIERRDGETRWVEATVSVLTRDGRPVGTQTILRDTTQQRDLLVENQALVELIDALPLAVNVLDRDAIVRLWNPAAERMFGWTKEEVLGRPYPLAHGRFGAEHKAWVRRTQGDGEALRGEETVRHHKDGSAVEVAVWSAPLRDADGNIGGSLGVMVDISEKRRAEADYQRLFERTLEAIVIFEPEDERILDANPAACAMYGVARRDFIGMSLKTFSTDIARGREAIAQTLENEATVDYESLHRRADGSDLWIESNASVVEYRGQTAILAINRDMTERRRMQQQLEHSQRLDAVGQLAAAVAHEFNNVLATVIGAAEDIADLARAPEVRDRTAEMLARVERGASFASQLLTFTQRREPQAMVVSVHETLRSMEPWLDRLLGDDVRLELATAAEVDSVRIDPVHMEQIVMNLAMNGRDAMPSGGGVRISTHHETLDKGRSLTTGEVEAGAYLVLSVADEGKGIDPAILGKIFTPFFTTKPRDKGTGLGLATLYRIVEDAGGQIEVASEIGRGSLFEVWIPTSTEAPARPIKSAPKEPRTGSETVLLVEDEDLMRRAFTKALSRSGYSVVAAANAAEALEHMDAGTATVDIVVTDVSMPECSGIELASQLHERWPDLPVLFMTGFAEADLADQCPRDMVLEKPFSRDVLTAAIRRCLDDDG